MLLPTQRRWVDVLPAEWHHFNLGNLYAVPPTLTPDELERAMDRLMRRNPALRTAYRPGATGWSAEVLDLTAEAAAGKAELADYRGAEEALVEEMRRAQTTLWPVDGRVLRFVHFPFGPDPGRLLLIVHHLTLDGFSLRIITDELEAALRGDPEGPPAATPHEYAEAVSRWVESDEARSDAEAWLSRPWDRARSVPTELDGTGTFDTMRQDTAHIGADVLRSLIEWSRTHAVTPGDLLLDAVAQAILARWELPALAVDTYHMGRHLTPMGIDVTDTIAYVQNAYQVIFEPRDAFHLRDLRAVPQRTFGFDALRFMSPYPLEIPPAGVRFNFRGHLEGLGQRVVKRPGRLLGPANEPLHVRRSEAQLERHLLMLDADIVGGRLALRLKYSTNHYAPDTVAALLDGALARVHASLT